jgi:hypothetical protein
VNKNDIIKWVLIAGAAYLVYRYLDSAGYFGTAATALPASQPAVAPAQITDGSTATTQTVTAQAAPSTDAIAQALIASIQAANMDPSGSYNGYQWSWFYQRTPLYKNEVIGPTDMQLGQTETVPLAAAAAKIRAFLAPGISGLSALMASQRFASAWTM